MKKLDIESFYHTEWHHDREDKTIQFYFWGKGDATWGIDKGFEKRLYLYIIITVAMV